MSGLKGTPVLGARTSAGRTLGPGFFSGLLGAWTWALWPWGMARAWEGPWRTLGPWMPPRPQRVAISLQAQQCIWAGSGGAS